MKDPIFYYMLIVVFIIQLRAALSAQLAVVVISSILGFITGIAWPIALLTVFKKYHYNQLAPLNFMDFFDPISHLLKLAPFIAAVVLIGKVENSGMSHLY